MLLTKSFILTKWLLRVVLYVISSRSIYCELFSSSIVLYYEVFINLYSDVSQYTLPFEILTLYPPLEDLPMPMCQLTHNILNDAIELLEHMLNSFQKFSSIFEGKVVRFHSYWILYLLWWSQQNKSIHFKFIVLKRPPYRRFTKSTFILEILQVTSLAVLWAPPRTQNFFTKKVHIEFMEHLIHHFSKHFTKLWRPK